MAIPMIAGPAAITLVLVKSSEENLSLINSLLNFFPIALVVIIAGFSMLSSGILSKYLNLTISLVLQRVFGLLLGALAIQFVIDGIKETFNIL
jgi:multiple antibiotic resistance protein